MQILNIKPSPLLGEIISRLKIAQEDEEITTKEEAMLLLNDLDELASGKTNVVTI